MALVSFLYDPAAIEGVPLCFNISLCFLFRKLSLLSILWTGRFSFFSLKGQLFSFFKFYDFDFFKLNLTCLDRFSVSPLEEITWGKEFPYALPVAGFTLVAEEVPYGEPNKLGQITCHLLVSMARPGPTINSHQPDHNF